MAALNSRSARMLTGVTALLAFIATQVITSNTTLNNISAIVALLAGCGFIAQQIFCVSERSIKTAGTTNSVLAIFIVGPFAARWFKHSDSAADLRTDRDSLWLLAATPQMLQTRLEQVRLKHPQAEIRLWLPLLPDGYDDATILATLCRRPELAAPSACLCRHLRQVK